VIRKEHTIVLWVLGPRGNNVKLGKLMAVEGTCYDLARGVPCELKPGWIEGKPQSRNL
jgi:hypothetical protein